MHKPCLDRCSMLTWCQTINRTDQKIAINTQKLKNDKAKIERVNMNRIKEGSVLMLTL